MRPTLPDYPSYLAIGRGYGSSDRDRFAAKTYRRLRTLSLLQLVLDSDRAPPLLVKAEAFAGLFLGVFPGFQRLRPHFDPLRKSFFSFKTLSDHLSR